MKNKIYAVLLLVSVSLLLTACSFGKKDGSEETSISQGETREEGTETIKGGLLDLVKRGTSIKCTYEIDGENGVISRGEIYVSGNKSSSELTIDVQNGERIVSYTLTDGEWMYIWTDGSQQGTKMSLSDVQQTADQEDSTGNINYSDYRDDIEYDCDSWIPDESKFTLPSNISFVDLGDLLNQFQNLNIEQ